MDTIGGIGGLMLGVKILLHIYIKTRVAPPSYNIGQGDFLNIEFIFPVTDDVGQRLKFLKYAANVLYCISILLIIIFLIAHNTK